MKHLYLIILILLCFIFVLGCVDATSAPNNDTQPNSGETTAPIQNDNPSDTTVADKTTQPDTGETTAPIQNDNPSDSTVAEETTQPDETDDIETASPVTLGPDETIPPYTPEDPTDRSMLLLEESNKLYSSFEKDPKDASKVIFPDDYAGNYIGNDGYLHIMVTSSSDDVDYYTAIVDPSLVRFHTVKYSLNQLLKVSDLIEPKMIEFKLVYPPHISEGANIMNIITYSPDMVDDINALLASASIDPGTYVITVYDNDVIPQ